MNTKDTLKLKVFESSLSSEDTTELLTMIEKASTIEDIDHINEVFSEKVKEIPYNEAAIITVNKKIIKTMTESDIAEEFKDVIKSMIKYNDALIDLWKKGVDPATDMQKYRDIYDEHLHEIGVLLDKKTLQMKLKYAELIAKGVKVDPSEVKEMKKQIDDALDFKKNIKACMAELKDNVIDAFKDAKKAAKSKVDELREKIEEVKTSKNDKAE